jgi:hypothetical protein
VITALPLHLLRDLFLALFVAVPIVGVAGALLALTRRGRHGAAPEASTARADGRTATRRSFLTYGAAGITTIAGASLGGGRLLAEARASGDTCNVLFTIKEGYVPMIDGTPVFMRGFGCRPNESVPLVPGPPIGLQSGDPGDGKVIFVKEDDLVDIVIQNTLDDLHVFTIEDPSGNFFFDPVPIPPAPAPPVAIPTFKAPRAGTYFYRDPQLAQTALGLHGVMVVMPKDGSLRPYGVDRATADFPDDLPIPPLFVHQYVWVLHDIDPVWGERARARTLTNANKTDFQLGVPEFLPRYFTINGVSGEASTVNPRTLPVIKELGQDASLIRIVNCGAATHSCHFHGNHVFVLQAGNLAFFRLPDEIDRATGVLIRHGKVVALEKDVIRVPPESTVDVLLPGHEPLDQYPPYDHDTAYRNEYPMHCHAEMSQTAGGGNYPSGMLADWELEGGIPRRRPVGS